MKKTLSILAIAILCLFVSRVKSQTLSISTPTSGLCINSISYGSVTNTVATATTYTWGVYSSSTTANFTVSSNGLSVQIKYPICGTFSVYCYAYDALYNQVGITYSVVSVACNSATPVNITSSPSNGTLCSGSSATLSSSGNTTYTWIPGNITGANIVVSPSTNVCYTVLATNSLGCFNMSSSYCMSVVPVYTMSISGNSVTCQGNSTSLSLSGGPSFVTNPGNINSANPILTPSVSTLYTIVCPSASYACPTYSTHIVLVNPTPTLNVTNTSPNLCAGSSRTLYAGGGLTYTWSTLAVSNSIVVTPTSSTCYSVASTSSINGCMSMAVHCVSVIPLPVLAISGNNTVCLGSSTTLSVSGGITYTWVPGNTNGSSLNVLPTSTTPVVYTIYGHDSNGCANFVSDTVKALNTCADVWPGDANRDGLVNSTDIIELGLAAASTGPVRSVTGNSWSSHFASAWTGNVSTGWNKAHADCNGDGVVSNLDTVAIYNNFSLTHSFKEAGAAAAVADISLIPASNVAFEGIWNKMDVILGENSNIQNQIYGLTFDLNYDQSVIENDSAKIVYTSSFFDNGNQNIVFGKSVFANGKLFCASVRTDHSAVSGNGKIAEFWYKVKSGIPENSALQVSISNGNKFDNTGVSTALTHESATTLNTTDNLTSVITLGSLENSIRIYPNPAKDKLILSSKIGYTISYSVFDLSGRLIVGGHFNDSKMIDLTGVSAGVYFVKFENGTQQMTKKLVIE